MTGQKLKSIPKEDLDKFAALPQELKDEFRLRFGHIISCGKKYIHVVSRSRVEEFLKENGYADSTF